MNNNDIISQLHLIGKANKWDVIELVASLNRHPVFRLRNSKIETGAKTGLPHLYSVTSRGIVFELNQDQIHSVIVSYDGFCKRIQ